MAVDFDFVELVHDASHMNVPADDGASLIRRLTSVDLIVHVGAVELRRKGWKLKRSVALKLSAKEINPQNLISLDRKLLSHKNRNPLSLSSLNLT